MVTLLFRKVKRKTQVNDRSVSVTSVPGGIVEQILLESMPRHLEKGGVTADGQHGFTEGKACLTNGVAFYDRIKALVGKGRATGVTSLDLCRAFDTVPRNILVSKMERCGLGGWTARGVIGWMGALNELQ